MKDVKFYFYTIEFELADNLTNFDLKDYLSKPLDIKQHLFDINEHRAFLEKKTDNIFSFQKFRKDFNPTIKDELTGQTREVDLKETESFIEEAYLYIDFSANILILQRNHSGYAAAAFEKYILQLLKDKFKNDFFALKPIMSKDGVEKLLHHNIAKSIDIKIAAVNVAVLDELGLDVKEIRDLDYDALNSIEIKITSKRKTGIFSLQKLINTLKIKQNKEKFERLKIKASSSYEGTGELVDLLDDFYVVVEKIKLKTKSRVIDDTDIIIKIGQIYDNNIWAPLKTQSNRDKTKD